MPESDTTVRTIPKRDGQEIRVRLKSYRGRVYGDLRLFIRTDAGEWVPTQKGITVGIDDLELLLEAVQALITATDEAQRAA